TMLSYLPITYGAKGQFYFIWGSWGELGSSSFGRSFSEENFEPRQENIYHQYTGQNSSKTGTLGEVNAKLNAWSPYLMSFDNVNRHSYIYRLDRSSLINETYFSDIKTYPPDNTNFNNPSGIPDPVAQTYLQAAVFKNPNEP